MKTHCFWNYQLIFISFAPVLQQFWDPWMWGQLCGPWSSSRLAQPWSLKNFPDPEKSKKTKQLNENIGFWWFHSQKKQKTQWKHRLFGTTIGFPLVLLRFSSIWLCLPDLQGGRPGLTQKLHLELSYMKVQNITKTLHARQCIQLCPQTLQTRPKDHACKPSNFAPLVEGV